MKAQRYRTCNYSEFDTAEDGEWTKASDTMALEHRCQGFERMCDRLQKRNEYLEARHAAVLALIRLLEVEDD